VAKLAAAQPASFVAFDLLALGSKDLRASAMSVRRDQLEGALQKVAAPVHLTPMTRQIATARDWLRRFEGAGLDGVVAKLETAKYEAGKRVMIKIKHIRTADCVVAGFRWHRGIPDAVGSLLLGLYDDTGHLQHVGVTSSFTTAMRKALVKELEPLRQRALAGHPWRDWADPEGAAAARMPGGQSRWSAGKDLSWEPLKPERVCEVKYDHLQGDRFRHAAIFLRWRPDKPAQSCRYDQLEVVTPYDLARVFATRRDG